MGHVGTHGGMMVSKGALHRTFVQCKSLRVFRQTIGAQFTFFLWQQSSTGRSHTAPNQFMQIFTGGTLGFHAPGDLYYLSYTTRIYECLIFFR